MKILLFTISMLVSLTGMLFKTFVDRRKAGFRKLNKFGWLLLGLSLLSIGFFIYTYYVDTQSANIATRNQQIKDSLSKVIDSVRENRTERNWKVNKEKNEQLIKRLRSDSVQNSKFQRLQKKYIVQSENYNELLSKNINLLTGDLSVLRHPFDSVLISITFKAVLTAKVFKQIYSLFSTKQIQNIELRDGKPTNVTLMNEVSTLLFDESFDLTVQTDDSLKQEINFSLYPTDCIKNTRGWFEQNLLAREYIVPMFDSTNSAVIINVVNLRGKRRPFSKFLSFKSFCNSTLHVFSHVPNSPGVLNFSITNVDFLAMSGEDYVLFKKFKLDKGPDGHIWVATTKECGVR